MHSTPCRRASAIALVAALAPTLCLAEYPWKERYEFALNPFAPTTGERLASAVGIAVSDCALSPGPGNDYTLTVMPRDTAWGLGDPTVCTNNPDLGPLCPQDPFYGQPTPGGACTAFLVDQDKVLTAGHCSPPVGNCSSRYVVFDWAILEEMNPPPSSGDVVIPRENVARCIEVLVDESPMSDGELPTVPENHDWALWKVEQLPPSRVPLPVDLDESIELGEAVAMLGHPARILLKGEVGTITGTGAHGSAGLHPVPGSSGSPVVSLSTGKAVGIATSGGMTFVEVPGCLDQGGTGWISDFGAAHGVSFQKSSTLSSLVPQVGLDVSPVIGEVDYYGEPGNLGSFGAATFQLSAPSDTTSEFPVAWARPYCCAAARLGPMTIVSCWPGSRVPSDGPCWTSVTS